MQTFFLVIDDIMDHSKLRRGKPCWYTLPGVGLNAINDGLLLDCSIDLVVRSAIPQHPKLSTILAAFYETKRKTVIGQMLDSDTCGVNDCTWPRYRQIVEHKTSHYTYLFPMLLGFHLADVTVGISELQPLAYRIGYLFQAHDDYLDCFGEESVTGKSSTDLAEGKCTWITCKALETLAKDPAKLDRFKSNFGKPDLENVRAARELVCSTAVDESFRRLLADTQRKLHADVVGYPLKEIQPILHSIVDEVGKAKKVESEKHEQENVRKVVENR
ncbi:polyprenyl synthetase [Aphelenchoides avenae]|nr:polyprenyl synthetase [Aphelenchus avenae]